MSGPTDPTDPTDYDLRCKDCERLLVRVEGARHVEASMPRCPEHPEAMVALWRETPTAAQLAKRNARRRAAKRAEAERRRR